MNVRVVVLFCMILLAAGCICPALGDTGSQSKKVIIGAMPFNEQYILAEIFGLLLEKE